MLDVRHGDALAEARRAVLLALDQRGDERIDGVLGDRARLGEGGDELAQRAITVGGGKVGDDGIADDEIPQFHGSVIPLQIMPLAV
jgi:hypothetical protein